MTDEQGCTAEEEGWCCTLPGGHEGPHEAWGVERIFCRWWPGSRIPRQDIWRDYIVMNIKDQS